MTVKNTMLALMVAGLLSACSTISKLYPFEKMYWNQSLLEQISRGESRGVWDKNPLVAWRRGGGLSNREAELFYANGDRVRARFSEGDGRLVFRPIDNRPMEVLDMVNEDVFKRQIDYAFFALAPKHQDFREAVNRRFFYGSYRVLTADGRETEQIVNFTPEGRLNGTDRFISYRLCMSQGCAGRYRGEVINLYDGQNWNGFILTKQDGQWVLSSVKMSNGAYVADRVYLRLLPISED